MEEFLHLVRDPAHWYFELMLIVIFDIIIGLLIWPFIQKALIHHKSDHERLEDLEREMEALKETKKMN